ncbi:hypothetical protein FOZ63_011292, partial [Perkinsus olseni]
WWLLFILPMRVPIPVQMSILIHHRPWMRVPTLTSPEPCDMEMPGGEVVSERPEKTKYSHAKGPPGEMQKYFVRFGHLVELTEGKFGGPLGEGDCNALFTSIKSNPP